MRDIRLRDSIPNLVGRLFRSVARIHNKALRGFDISAVQATVLTVLWSEGPLTMGELQAMLALKSSTLTGTIDRMEEAKLVRRVEEPGDRRAWRIEPVAWPARKQAALVDQLMTTEGECFARLTSAERKELVRLLHKAVASIESVSDDAD
jgi:DNA-binding MarR family transcriptional regulator